MKDLIQKHRRCTQIAQLILLIILYLGLLRADPCPLPCWCVDQNTTVVCNLTGLTEIPRGLPRNVKTLLLRSNAIDHISKTDLQGLNNLENIDLTRNKLTVTGIEKGAFNLPSVKFLDLSDNLLDSIPDNLPPNLSTLNFFYNPIIELKAGSFQNKSSIQNLNMLGNQLETVTNQAFDGLTNVLEIDLSSNQLTDEGFNGKAFNQTSRLNTLKLNYNKLQSIPDTKHFPSSLQTLQLYGNNINVINGYAFSTMANLTFLAVAQGRVTKIDDYAFQGLSNLTTLDLSQGRIVSNIANDTFAGLSSLQSLSLDINNIATVANDAFHALRKIKVITMTGNNLTTLNPSVFDTSFIPNLSAVYIYGNPWICDCHLRWLREKMDNASYKVGSPDSTICAAPPSVAGKTWAQLKPSDFKC